MPIKAAADGVPIRPVFGPRATGALLGLIGSQNPFSGTRTYQTIAHLPLAERVARMRDPEIRAKILSEDPKEFNKFPLFHRLRWDLMFRFGNPPIYAPKKEDSFAAIAAREGRTPEEVTYDALLESDGTDFIYTTISSYAYGDLSDGRNVTAQSQLHHGTGRWRRARRVHSGRGVSDLDADALGPDTE